VNSPQSDKNFGYVFNIQHYSVHDGPGIRTIVFLKGCPLECRWCSNPESQKIASEVAYNFNKCIGVAECFRCGAVCPAQAVKKDPGSKITIDRQECQSCFACAEACPSKALHVFGSRMNVADVLKIVERDSVFYSRSGGGLTLSGGEPLMQADFVVEMAKEAKKRRIHTAMETCGHAEWPKLEEVCRYLNAILYDIKTINPEKHKSFTGISNELILENFLKLRRSFPKLDVWVRTPLVPGFNDTEEDIRAILEFIGQVPRVNYELLPYHRMGQSKYQFLNRDYPMGDVKLSDEKAKALMEFAREYRASISDSVVPIETVQRRIPHANH